MRAPAGCAATPPSSTGRTPIRIGAAVALAWAGLVIHNVADLPGQTVVGPETVVPTILWLLALGLALGPDTRRVGLWVLLGWATVNLVGGALSVLPLAILPFVPEQTVRHYAFHGIYAAAQIPLMVLAVVFLRRSATHRSEGPDRLPR